MAIVLSLPSEAEDEGVTFSQAMAAAWAGEESRAMFAQRAGVGLDQETLRGVLRRRVECWR